MLKLSPSAIRVFFLICSFFFSKRNKLSINLLWFLALLSSSNMTRMGIWILVGSFVLKQPCRHVKWLRGSSGIHPWNLNAYLNFIWTILSFLGSVKLELKSHGNWLSQKIFGEPETASSLSRGVLAIFTLAPDRTRKFRGEWEWKIMKW